MALDSANFIAELSITDPPGTDPLSQGDDQIRTTKRATQQSFPFIDKQVDLTADQMNEAAIKNEANIFTITENTFTNQVNIKKSGATQLAGHFYFDEFDVARWGLFLSTTANSQNFQLQRRDFAGVLLDLPIVVRNADGVVEFVNVPEIDGSPLWLAGEIRQFIAAAAPGGNWFKADGTNGTVNLAGRHLMTESAFDTVGTSHDANVEKTQADSDGTILTVGQMPSHDHGLLGDNLTGVSAGLLAANARGCMGAGSITPEYVFTTGFGDNLMQSTGLNQSHNHGVPEFTLDDPSFTNSVRPLGFVVSSYQYVP